MTDLPRPSELRPRRLVLHALRPVFRLLVGRLWDVHVHGREHVPARGPVVFASNHVGWLDGPLLAIVSSSTDRSPPATRWAAWRSTARTSMRSRAGRCTPGKRTPQSTTGT